MLNMKIFSTILNLFSIHDIIKNKNIKNQCIKVYDIFLNYFTDFS